MRMTFREIAIYADGVNERRNEEWKSNFRALYTLAKLIRANELPKLEDLLPPDAAPKTLTKKERERLNRDRFKAWSDRHNTRFAKKKKKAKT